MVIYTKLELNGVEIKDAININLKKTTNSFNGTSSLSADFENIAGFNKNTFSNGDNVVLYAENVSPPTNKIFGGNITEVNFNGQGLFERVTIQARDYYSQLQNIEIDIEIYTSSLYGTPSILFEILQGNMCHMESDHKIEIVFPEK